jgi:monothiol glutaredoxin
MWTTDEIKNRVTEHKVIVFGKGTKQMPQCGFTMRAIQILTECQVDFEVINIFDDPSIRPALCEFSNWPTTPQVFVDGEFLGGSDILTEMFQSGDLQKKLQAATSTSS